MGAEARWGSVPVDSTLCVSAAMLLPVVLRHRAVWAGRGLAVASAAAAVAGAAGVCSTRRTATVACAERRGSSSAAEPASPDTARVPLFSFGVIADVQWLDAEDGYNYARTVKRCYRGALDVLGLAVDWWCARQDPPLFIAQLGDLIDGQNRNGQSQTALDGALAHLDRAPCPVVNLIGNHELYNFSRAELADRLGTAPPVDGCVLGTEGGREFYSFLAAPGWRFLVLDAYRDAVIGYSKDDPRFIKNAQWLSDRNPNINPADPDASGDWLAGIPRGDKSRRFVPYNGGLGTEQLAWLRAELHDAARLHERVVVLSHVILHPKACDVSSALLLGLCAHWSNTRRSCQTGSETVHVRRSGETGNHNGVGLRRRVGDHCAKSARDSGGSPLWYGHATVMI